MKKIISALFIFGSLCTGHSASAQVTPIEPQEEDADEKTPAKEQSGKSPFWDKIVIGGNLGAAFGNTTYIDISPLVGYKITPKFIAGAGLTYQFVRYRDPYDPVFDYKATIIGPRVFAQYDLIYGLFAYAEYENLWVTINPDEPLFFAPYNAEYPGLLPGLGYKANIGSNAYLKILALYDLLWSSDNILYNSPFQIRLGFSFGG